MLNVETDRKRTDHCVVKRNYKYSIFLKYGFFEPVESDWNMELTLIEKFLNPFYSYNVTYLKIRHEFLESHLANFGNA